MKTLKHALLAAAAYGKGPQAKKLRSGLCVVAAFAGLAGLIALTDPPRSGAAASSGPGVTVLNTPLPISPTGTQTVAGTVGISGTPGVNVMNTPSVMLSGTPTVSVSGMPTVSLAPGASFRDTDNAARQPFQRGWGCNLTGGNFCTDSASIVVPTGKELVIEFVTLFAQAASPAKGLFASVLVKGGGINLAHQIPLNFIFDDGSVTASGAAQQTRLYADPSTTVSVQCSLTASSASGFCDGSVSGYLVDVP